MKYLFITLTIQDGERSHTHRILHSTNAIDIKFAAQRYAASYWGHGSHTGEWWWFQGEVALKLDFVTEISQTGYDYLSLLFGGGIQLESVFEVKCKTN